MFRATRVWVLLVLVGFGMLFSAHSARAIYCYCFNATAGGCTKGTWTNQNEFLTCDQNGPLSCNQWCSDKGMQAIHCDENNLNWEDKYQWQTDGSAGAYGGCKPSACWCRGSNNECKKYLKNTATDKYFLNKEECDSFCLGDIGRNTGEWKSVFFDNITSHLLEDACQKTNTVQPVVKPKERALNGNISAVESNTAALRAAAADRLNPGNFTAATDLVGVAIRVVLGLIGSLALVLYIYAGVLWMTAMGNSERSGTAKSILVWTSLGLVAMLGSYLVVRQIFTYLKLMV